LRGAGQGVTIIKQNVLDRVMQLVGGNFSGAGARVVLQDLTIEGGRAQDSGIAGQDPGDDDALGGGILSNQGVLTLNHVTIIDCIAAGKDGTAVGVRGTAAKGGGIYSFFSTVVLNDATITDCHAIAGTGRDGASGVSPISGGDGGVAYGGGMFMD